MGATAWCKLLLTCFVVANSPDAWYGGGTYGGTYPSHVQDDRIYQDGGGYYQRTSAPATRTRGGELSNYRSLGELVVVGGGAEL